MLLYGDLTSLWELNFDEEWQGRKNEPALRCDRRKTKSIQELALSEN